MSLSDATIESKFFFQFVFCAVSLAIVWGTTLERIKFGVYVIYAIVFSALIYPIGAHWVFGGGFLQVGDCLGTRHRRDAGLRRLDGGPPDRRDRRARGAAAARPAERQVRRRRQAAGDPGAHDAAVRARGADPVARLVRVQPGLDPERARRPLRRDPDHHQRGRGRRRARRGAHGAAEDGHDRHRHGRQRRDRRPGRDHRSVRLRRVLGGADHRRGRRRDRRPRRLRDRQVHRRPGRRAFRARPRRHLGNALVRAVHLPAPGPVQRLRRPRGRALLHGLVRSADRPGARRA